MVLMKKKFPLGTRVQLNAEWVQHNGGFPQGFFQHGVKGTIVGYSRLYPEIVRVKFDSRKTIEGFHESFFSKVRKKG